MTQHQKPLVLIILDGWGHSEQHHGDAIAQANTPQWDELWQKYPHTLLQASGETVGLPANQMGNSEVGHLHIGAGRLVPQELTRINRAIDSGEFYQNSELTEAMAHAIASSHRIHLIGLLSPGGVHSHEKHIQAAVKMAYERGSQHVCIHAVLDGRDTPPRSAQASIEALESTLRQYPCGEIASISGRYYAMDRDKRWDRTQQVYELLTQGEAAFSANSALEALREAYERDENDEFVQPTKITPSHQQQTTIDDGDTVIFLNFRADRARQLSWALSLPDFDHFTRHQSPKLGYFVTLTQYDINIPSRVAFPPQQMQALLGEEIANQGLTQLRLTETEKYAHVTFFFNGGQEQAYPNEDRHLIPSPKVKTYEQAPAMSAAAITDELIKQMRAKYYDLIVVNYANADMVGHTGDFHATVQALETLDGQFKRIMDTWREVGGDILITADHGNAEKMLDPQTEQAHTAHTSSLVPFILISQRHCTVTAKNGTLIDIAPTVLDLLDLSQPKEMTGKTLLHRQN